MSSSNDTIKRACALLPVDDGYVAVEFILDVRKLVKVLAIGPAIHWNPHHSRRRRLQEKVRLLDNPQRSRCFPTTTGVHSEIVFAVVRESTITSKETSIFIIYTITSMTTKITERGRMTHNCVFARFTSQICPKTSVPPTPRTPQACAERQLGMKRQ